MPKKPQEQLYSTASYSEKNLQGIGLCGNNLTGWNFAGQDLTNANLQFAKLGGADLSQAIFSNARLDANLTGSVFDADTIYNQWTIFPVGFDAAMDGLAFIGSDPVDLDGSDGLTVADVDLLSTRLQDINFMFWQFAMFDLNGGDAIDAEDLRFWVVDLTRSQLGDADLDGDVGFPDLLALSASFGGPGGWGQGDFDADGEVQFSDFLVLSNNFGQGSTEVAAVVPEPNSALLGIIGWMIFSCARRNRSVRRSPTGQLILFCKPPAPRSARAN